MRMNGNGLTTKVGLAKNGYNPNGGVYNINQINEFLSEAFEVYDMVKTGRRTLLYNIPASFDIETTSFYGSADGEIKKQAIMYVWQFGINGYKILGRTWDEFGMFIGSLVDYAKLNSNCRLVIYVHNLSFEFQFLQKWFKWDNVFTFKTRRPVYAITGGLEFRCSYFLSNYNLEYLGKNLLTKYPRKKMVGDLDYSLIRHTQTPLTKKEIGYCVADVDVVMSYIQQKIEEDGDISKIPLTNTGYVRNHCRDVCFGEISDDPVQARRDGMNYRAIIRSLQMTADEYDQAKRAFMGGLTHASAFWSNKTLTNVDVNDDEASAYPAQLAYKYFPMSSAIYIGKVTDRQTLDKYLKMYCCMFDVYFVNLQPKVLFENIISVSRCEFVDSAPYVSNNGRLVSCYSEDPDNPAIFRTTVTELDFEMIEKFYTFEGVFIENLRIYKRGYLPTVLVKAILDFYKGKTSLKDVAGKETEYMVSKNMLNSSFGMMVTDIVRDMFEYEGATAEWSKTHSNTDESIEKYNKSYTRFLFYPWGVWTTAHARHCLCRAILELGEDYVYADTDCVKGFNYDKHKEWFKKYNIEIKALAIQASARHGIPMEYFMPKTPKGKEKLLGIWEHDPGYTRFKTCGAKRYIYEQPNESSQLEMHMVVAGLGKNKALPYLLKKFDNDHTKIFDYFQNGMYIPAEHTGKLTHTYIDEEQEGTIIDYKGQAAHYFEQSSVHLESASFEMSLLPQYLNFLFQTQLEVGTYEK